MQVVPFGEIETNSEWCVTVSIIRLIQVKDSTQNVVGPFQHKNFLPKYIHLMNHTLSLWFSNYYKVV